MKVKELIKKLKEFPDDAYVLVTMPEYSHPVEMANVVNMGKDFGPYFGIEDGKLRGFSQTSKIKNPYVKAQAHPCIWLVEYP